MSEHNPIKELRLSREEFENLGLSDEDLEQVAGGTDPDATTPQDSTTIIIIIDRPDA
jgi:hypothetical protein